jgi:Outer membrane protein beta-barrel domain
MSDLRTVFGTFVVGSCLCLVFLSATAHAQDDEDEVVGYDVIVENLNRQVTASDAATSKANQQKPPAEDPFETVWMHAGAGFVQNVQAISLPDGNTAYLSQKGVQASVGIDLFSPNWAAEGTVRSFNDNDDKQTQVTLKEFELKAYYKDRIARSLGLRVGGGISGRYMTISRPGLSTLDYTTPSSVGTVGLDLFLTDRFSIGAEISGRSAMITETLDRGSLDGSVRLDAHF